MKQLKRIIFVAFIFAVLTQAFLPNDLFVITFGKNVYAYNNIELTVTPTAIHTETSAESPTIKPTPKPDVASIIPTDIPTSTPIDTSTNTPANTSAVEPTYKLISTPTVEQTSTSTNTPTVEPTYKPTNTSTPESTNTPTNTPTNTTPTPTCTSTPTKLPENCNVVIEGWIKGDRNEDKSGFVVEVFLGYRNISEARYITNSDGYYKLAFNTDTSYTVKINKPDSAYLPRLYRLSLIGRYKQGLPDSPDIMYWRDLNKDGDINMLDIMEIAKSFNSVAGEKRYSSNADIDCDGAINMIDVVKLCKFSNVTVENQIKSIYLESDTKTCFESSSWYNFGDTVLNLNGKKLYVDGNLVFKSTSSISEFGSTLDINGGCLEVTGEFDFGQPEYKDILIMTKESGHLIVGKGFIYASSANHEGKLTAGTIELKGSYFNVNEDSVDKAFYATGKHKVLLSGNEKQTIKLSPGSPEKKRKINVLISSNPKGFEVWPKDSYVSFINLLED